MTDHFLTRAKAYAALILAIVTAFLGTVPPHTQLWTILTFVAAVLTGVSTYSVGNKKAAPKGDGGSADVGLILLILTLIGVVLLLFRVHFGG